MKRYFSIILVALSFLTMSLYAQQAPHYTQFMYNMNMVNPAYAGIKNGLAGGILYRTQWVGQAGHPETFTFNVHSRVGQQMGLGISALKDQFGPVDQTGVKLDYSYTLELGGGNNLAFGLNVGANFLNVDLPSLIVIHPNDPLLAQALDETEVTYGAGLFFYSDKYYISLSAPNLNTQGYKLLNSNYDQGNAIHYFLAGGYVFDLSNNFKLKPNFMAYQAIGSPFAVSLNANLFMYDKVEVGLSYRVGDSFSGLVNFLISENLRVGYAYDRTTSSMSLYSPNSHEVFLNFEIPYKKKRLISPIYF